MMRRLVRSLDARVGGAPWLRKALRHVFPDHWSFMFGEVALYSFIALVVSGVYLTLFFEPSSQTAWYAGRYGPLQGVEMSAAYESVVRMSFDVRGGLLLRQVHHWAALVFVAAISVHAARVFFTGAFRKPRDLNWMVGVTLLVLALGNGFLGYSLLDDLLSGIGLRIAYSLAESIPLVGPWVASLAFGGEFPTESYLHRFYVLHVLVVPAAIATLIAVHLALIWRQRHTQFPGPDVDERTVVGSPLFPTYALKSLSLLLAVAGLLFGLGSVAQINPVWLWGPYDPAAVTSDAQPDWYVGWLEGALRLFPPWEVRAAGFVIPNPFFPALLMPAVFFAVLYAYPAIERRVSGDRADHELLDRPRDRPVRTGLGAGVLAYFVVLLVAGSQDVLSHLLGVSVQAMVVVLRVAVVVVPVAVGAVAWLWCRQLATGADPARPTAPGPAGEHATEEPASGGGA
ncbi:MAG: cytochrome bc complex cytochrome b subunit [Acidimicrobiia bacterium]